MASIEEVRAGIAAANDKATESLGRCSRRTPRWSRRRARCMQATEGSGQADVSEANGLLPQAVSSIDEVAAGLRRRSRPRRVSRTGCELGRRRCAVTDSLGELRAVLAGSGSGSGTARVCRAARARLADARGRAHRAGGAAPEPLVPPELRRAADELDRGLGLISGRGSRCRRHRARL